MKIISVVGARPNFMKIAPFIHEINNYNKNSINKIEHILVHTGQHYDDRMSKLFFESLDIPEADINLEVGSGSHAEQVGYTMIAFEKVLYEHQPDWVIVVGDVNATLACSVAAKKLHIKVCHIEAGLRSGDMKMPEEINRLVTDRLSDLLLTPDRLSSKNLYAEGIEDYKIKFVGNIMIDTLYAQKNKAEVLSKKSIIENNIYPNQNIPNEIKNSFVVVTLHRPSNVDEPIILSAIVDFFINEVSKEKVIFWPVHPRTAKKLEEIKYWDKLLNHPKIFMLHPLAYHDLLKLNIESDLILTDSGGLQEECTVLGTPCLTLRWNTERPITLVENGGVSVLVGNNIEKIKSEYFDMLKNEKKPIEPELWDGKTAIRCLNEIINYKTE
jgi:UDP-N-acetylglucosamine 2-epimerase (non-hydrolysing)